MLKRCFVLLAVVSLLFSSTVLAEGNVTVEDKNAIIYAGKSTGYFYAKVKNDGDAPIGVNNCKLVIFSDNDDILETKDYISTYPSRLMLEPGEYTYISEFLWNDSLENKKIGDVKFSVETKDQGDDFERIPCEVTYDIKGSSTLDNYVYLTIKNESDETRYAYYGIVALLDTEGKLIFVDHNCYENMGVHPGSTVTIKVYIDSDMVDYIESNNITIGSADALCYYRKKE